MAEFTVKLQFMNEPTRDMRGRYIYQMALNDEWTIVCVMDKVRNNLWNLNSIEIHRKNISTDFSVSGRVAHSSTGLLQPPANLPIFNVFQKRFSLIIPKGSSFIQVCSNIDRNIYDGFDTLAGFVHVFDVDEEQGESKSVFQAKSLDQLSEDFGLLLDPQPSCLADVYLKCDSASIPAHKLILSARSPVFAAMFTHQTKESQKNEVEITDIDASVLRAMLKYIYTGKTSDMTASQATDLILAADSYQLQDLKKVCSYYLKDTICLKNVWKFLVFGHLHDPNLKSFAIDYICYKFAEFSLLEDTKEWKDLRNEKPDLAMDLLENMVKHRDKKIKRMFLN